MTINSKLGRGKWGKADYLRKGLDQCFIGCCFLPVIMSKGKFLISALIFLWTTFYCIRYKLEKFDPEEKKTRFGFIKIAGQKRTVSYRIVYYSSQIHIAEAFHRFQMKITDDLE